MRSHLWAGMGLSLHTFQMGKDGPVVSSHGGKAVIARGFELAQLNLKMLDEPFADGEKIQCPAKEIGNSGNKP